MVWRALPPGLALVALLTLGLPRVHGAAEAQSEAPSPAHAVGRFEWPAGAESAPTPPRPPSPWRVVRLSDRVPPTDYTLRRWDGVTAVQATAQGSMALLARSLSGPDVEGPGFSLAATPVLCWRWRVNAALSKADMTTRAGDDYAARVYVAFALPPEALSWATRAQLQIGRRVYGELLPDAAVNYVWDNRQPIGTRRPNAYTDRTQMTVLRSGNQDAGRWVNERRDVLADAIAAFGTAPSRATLLAVASDTDNTGEQATAGFADLHFVPRDAPCDFK